MLKVKYINKYGLSNEDKEILEELEKQVFGQDLIYPKNNHTYWWIAYYDDIPIGYAGLDHHATSNTAYFCRLGILKEYRRLGIGTKMIQARKRMAKKLGVKYAKTDCVANNPCIINLLFKNGFRAYNPSKPWALPSSIYLKWIIE